MILINHDRLGTDWHLDASIRSVCSMNFNNLLHHFPGCGELPEYGVSDNDYGPLPPPSPSLTPEIKAIVGELLVSIKERVIGHPILKHDKNLHTFTEEVEQTEEDNGDGDEYCSNLENLRKKILVPSVVSVCLRAHVLRVMLWGVIFYLYTIRGPFPYMEWPPQDFKFMSTTAVCC